MYHQITASPPRAYTRYTVTPRQFDRQMSWLRLRGYQSLSLDALQRCRSGLEQWPPKPIVITFDDGYEEAARYALDVMPKYGFTATMFLVAGAIGQTSGWDQGVSMPLVGWDAVRGMVRAGFTIGSHSLTHANLTALEPKACARELRESRARLEDRLGSPVVHVAYPYGAVNQVVRDIAAEAGYVSGCTATLDLATATDDALLLPRVLVVSSDSMADFICRLRTARTVGVMARAYVGSAFRRTIVGLRASGACGVRLQADRLQALGFGLQAPGHLFEQLQLLLRRRPLLLPRVVEHRPSAKRRRDCAFVRDGGIDVRLR